MTSRFCGNCTKRIRGLFGLFIKRESKVAACALINQIVTFQAITAKNTQSVVDMTLRGHGGSASLFQKGIARGEGAFGDSEWAEPVLGVQTHVECQKTKMRPAQNPFKRMLDSHSRLDLINYK